LTYRDLRLSFLIQHLARRWVGWSVRVISKRRLREFWESWKHNTATAERDLSVWYKVAKGAQWANFGALRQSFGSADQVGNCVVFDVGNNRFRLVGRVNYGKGILYVLRVMDHSEYDKKTWVDQCGCDKPPPKKPAAAKKTLPRTKPARRGRKGGR
jgi:mRNA interferase HigB